MRLEIRELEPRVTAVGSKSSREARKLERSLPSGGSKRELKSPGLD